MFSKESFVKKRPCAQPIQLPDIIHMSFLRNLFGRKSDVWRPFAEELGGRFIEGDSWKSSRVEFEHPGYVTVLTAEFDVETNFWATRVRTKLRTHSDARISLMKNWPWAKLFDLLGMFDGIAAMADMRNPSLADLQMAGDGFLMSDTQDEFQLFESDTLRSGITQQQKLMLLVGEPYGLPFARTAGQSELLLLIPGIVTDVDQLRSALDLHAA